jgi:hypothetical protein
MLVVTLVLFTVQTTMAVLRLSVLRLWPKSSVRRLKRLDASVRKLSSILCSPFCVIVNDR